MGRSRLLKLLVIALLALIVGACLNIPSPEKIKSLELTPKSMRPRDVRLMGTTFDLKLEVYNPNLSNVTLDRFEFKIFLDGRNIVFGRHPSVVEIPGQGKTDLVISFDLLHAGAGETIFDALVDRSDKQFSLSIECNYLLRTIVGEIPFTFAKDGIKIKELVKKWKD